jgi:hypothetical protein
MIVSLPLATGDVLMSEKMFSAAMVAAWSDGLDRRPLEVSEIEYAAGIPDIESFASTATNASIVLRFRGQDGSTYACELNPVVARHLAATILHKGFEAGWLTELGDVTAPDRPPLDS